MIANALVNKCKFLVTRYGCGDFTFDLDAVMRCHPAGLTICISPMAVIEMVLEKFRMIGYLDTLIKSGDLSFGRRE
jgi:hypothetical protein